MASNKIGRREVLRSTGTVSMGSIFGINQSTAEITPITNVDFIQLGIMYELGVNHIEMEVDTPIRHMVDKDKLYLHPETEPNTLELFRSADSVLWSNISGYNQISEGANLSVGTSPQNWFPTKLDSQFATQAGVTLKERERTPEIHMSKRGNGISIGLPDRVKTLDLNDSLNHVLADQEYYVRVDAYDYEKTQLIPRVLIKHIPQVEVHEVGGGN